MGVGADWEGKFDERERVFGRERDGRAPRGADGTEMENIGASVEALRYLFQCVSTKLRPWSCVFCCHFLNSLLSHDQSLLFLC